MVVFFRVFFGSSLSTRLPASRHVHDGPRDGCRDLVAMRVAGNPALGYQLHSGDIWRSHELSIGFL